MSATGDMTEVTEPFWPAVQCVEGGWSPSQNNVLSKDREEAKPEVKWHAAGPYGEQVAEPSKMPGAAEQSLQASLTPSGSQLRNPQECCPCRPHSLPDTKAPGPVSHCGMLQQLWAGVFVLGTVTFLSQRISPNYSVKQGWQNSLEITVVFNIWWEQLFGKKRFLFFVEPDLRGFISCAPQDWILENWWTWEWVPGYMWGFLWTRNLQLGGRPMVSCLPTPASSHLPWQQNLPWNATISSQYHTQRAIRTSQGKSEQPQGCLMECLPSLSTGQRHKKAEGWFKASL